MLGVKPGEIIHSLKNDGFFNGIKLPSPFYNRGSHTKPMFKMVDVIQFVNIYHESSPDRSGE